MPATSLADSLTGSALGLFCGDALGAPVEGMPRAAIAQRAGWVAEMLGGRGGAGTYTDDTQLMIGILQALEEDDALPPGLLARTYAANYQPWRGYGASTGQALAGVAAGRLGPEALSRDSFGNGGAMGIAPLGVYFSADLQEVAAQASRACATTHTHPEAVSCAVAVATAAALLSRHALEGGTAPPMAVLEPLLESPGVADTPVATPLARLRDLPVQAPPAERADWLAAHYPLSVRAVESVPAAVGAALSAATLREGVEVAVNAGGDADTLGAIAGGLAGAFFGAEALPEGWLAALENGEQGRDAVRALTGRLAARLAA